MLDFTNEQLISAGYMPKYFEIDWKFLNWKGKLWLILCFPLWLIGEPTEIFHCMIDREKLLAETEEIEC